MKRVLLLNYEFPPLGGGASPMSFELARRLSETGKYDIDVVTMRFSGLAAYQEINPQFRIHRVPCLRSKKELCHPWEQLTYLITGYFKAASLIRRKPYDICHTHFIIPTGALAYVLKKQFGLSYVITSHGSDVLGYGKRFRALYPLISAPWRTIIDNATQVTSPSAYLKERILTAYGAGLKPERVSVIPNGIDTSIYTESPKKKIIFSSGRLLRTKGFQYLIQAVSAVDSGYVVHIAGDGPMLAELKLLAARSKTPVVLHGWLDSSSAEYRTLLAEAAVFVLASDKENASMVLLEALANGCAVITTSGSGSTEMVGDAGLLVSAQSSSELSRALDMLISDDSLRTDLQRKARARAQSEFNWHTIVQKYSSQLV